MHSGGAEDSAASNGQVPEDTDPGDDIGGTEGTPELNGKSRVFSILHLVHMLHTPNLLCTKLLLSSYIADGP
jgi:hypothetical protein